MSYTLSILSLQGEHGSEGQKAIDRDRVSTAISSRHIVHTQHINKLHFILSGNQFFKAFHFLCAMSWRYKQS